MKLIVVSNSKPVEDETRIVTRLFEHGLMTFHLRKPKLSTKELKRYIAEIPEEYHNRIVIHSHHNIAFHFDLKGVHLTRKHRYEKVKTWVYLKLLKYRNPDLLVTTSLRRMAQLAETEEHYDYVFLSPIFDNLTHKYHSGFNEQGLRASLSKTPLRVIARGGIEIETIARIPDLGFYGAALYSVLWKRQNPLEEFKKILEYCREKGIEIE